MIFESPVEQVLIQSAVYSEELRAIYKNHSLAFGSPDDLSPITSELSKSGALTDEVSAKIRSIIYREQENLTEADLLQLLVWSIGGPEIEANSPPYQEPLAHLSAFLGGALRTFWRNSPTGPYKSRLAENAPRSSTPSQTSAAPQSKNSFAADLPILKQPLYEQPLQDEHIAKNQEAVAAEVARMMERERRENSDLQPARFIEEITVLDGVEHVVGGRTPNGGVLLASTDKVVSLNHPQTPAEAPTAQSAQTSFPKVMPASPRLPLQSIQVPENAESQQNVEEDGVFPEYRSLHILRPEHRALWIVGALGILLGLLIGIFLHAHGSVDTPAEPRIVSPEHSSGPSNPKLRSKPSPYTSTLGNQSTRAVTSPLRYGSSHEVRPAQDGATQPEAQGTSRLPVRVAGRVTAQAPTARYSPETSGTAEATPSEADRILPSAGAPATEPNSAALASRAVYLSASGVMAGNLIAAPAPAYPAAASASGVQGKVVVQALVGRDGHVLDAHVISGDQLLREAALNAVSRWRYRPFLAEGKASEIETTAILDFRIFR